MNTTMTPPRVHVSRRGSVTIDMNPTASNTSPPRASPNRISYPTPTAKSAQSRREGVDAQKAYDRLHKQFKNNSTKLQKKNEECKQKTIRLSKRDQQISFLNRQIERLTSESTKATAGKKEAELARRKIETELAGGSGGQYLAEKYQALRKRTRALKNRCEAQAEVLDSQETNLHRAATEIDILARALEVRVHELGLAPGKRSKGKQSQARDSLIYEVAQQRSEMQQMVSIQSDAGAM